MKNLSTEHSLDEHLKPVKDSDGNSSALEISTEKVRVKDLEVTGTTTGIETGTSITVDSSLTDGSTNPVENNAVYDGLATKLNLSGGTVTGAVHMDDDVKIEFGDADEYIKGDGDDLHIVSSTGIDFENSRLKGIDRISFSSGGTFDDCLNEDDMASDSDTAVASQQSIKAYVDNNSHIKVATVTLGGADMNDLHTTKIDIIPAQGASKVIIPTSGMLFIDRDSSTAQSKSTVNLFVGYNGTSSISETIYYIRRFMYNEAGDRIFHLQHYTGEAGNSLTYGDNVPLTVKLDNAITSGSIDSMKISVSYYVFDNS